MANEITLSGHLRVEKGTRSLERIVSGLSADWDGTIWSYEIQPIGSGSGGAHEALQISADIAVAGDAWFRNLDDANTIQIGTVVGGEFEPFLSLSPGKFAICELATTELYAQAIDGPAELEYWLLSGS